MKNLVYIMVLSLLAFSCGDFEEVIYDPATGQTGVGFTTPTSAVTVPVDGITVEVSVLATNTAAAARSFNVSVNQEESSEGINTSDFALGNVVIPAGSFEGILEVTFGNYDNLVDLVTQTLVLDLALPEGVAVVGSSSTTFNYVKAVVCNDVTLTLVEDAYADERDWQITDSSGVIVVQCSDYADCPGGQASGSVDAATYTYNFNLVDGCYTLTVFDSYGDGMADGNITGNYSLTCSVITHASDEGNFGAESVTDFCVNP